MASLAPAIPRTEVTAVLKQVQGPYLLNRQLSSICQVNGLKSTGVKADLQRRIVTLIHETVNANDVSRFQQIRQSIHHTSSQRSTPVPKGAQAPRAPTFPSQPPASNGYMHPMPSYHTSTTSTTTNGLSSSLHSGGGAHRSYNNSSIVFQPSPFYHIEAPISDLRTAEVMTQHKNTVSIAIRLGDHPSLQRCTTDPTYRVMIFCASETVGVQPISFPQQAELRVNGGDVKANLRGLKNKPGSTRPADITSNLRLRPNYQNNVEFVYALTTKKFYLIANLCRVTPIEDLVTMISTRHRIPKQSVINELNKKAQDPDVIATSQVLSLKCPLSYMRLALPCRSLSCTHIQCFDATSYLQLQEQGPQWLCPICNKSAPFEQLAVDEYVKDILENTSSDLETVTIEPNGVWAAKATGGDKNGSSGRSPFHDDDEDDDDLEISEISIVGGRRNETPKQSTPYLGTPVSGGRDASSSAPRGTATTSGKRPASAVIDLTLSDDEEEERPAKRQTTSSNGIRGPSAFDYAGK